MLILATALLYGQVIGHDFIRLDDEGYVTQNVHVKAGLAWETLRWSLFSTEEANWHPLTWISHALDCQIFGLRAGGHHFTSMLFHLLNVGLLFLVLRKATGSTSRSFLVAALFAWHPFNVESVAWVAERKNVLSTFLFLLDLAAYGWYAQKPNWKRYLTVAALLVLALSAKPMVVTLPFVLLLLDFWPLRRIHGWTAQSLEFPLPQWSWWILVLEKLPLLALAGISSFVTLIAQRGTIATTENLPLILRGVNAFYSYLMYVWKMFWPSGFALYYPHPFVATPNHEPPASLYALAIVGAASVVAGGVIAWRQRSVRPYLLTGWLWYVGTLVPVIGIVQVGMQAMADRYAYVPLIGLFVLTVWGCADLLGGVRIQPVLRTAAIGIILAILWALSFRQIGFWQSGYDIWAHTLDVTENNFVADDNMADALMSLGEPDSIRYFEEAARIAPQDGVSHGAVAAYLEDQGRMEEAINEFQVVVQNPPSAKFLAFAYANLGIIYTELGQSEKAQAAFHMSVTTDRPAMDEMIDRLAQTADNRPADEAYVRLGLLLEQAGRTAEARTAYYEALKLNPNRTEVQQYADRLATKGS